ncbi:MAG TPA: Flp pilus assembly protein CpaB [Thermomicrobiales bacterium]|nr:Flp pilus assembly protein CpaB [Thermomicrobiales bacterium]
MRSGGKGFIIAGVALGLLAVVLVVVALAGASQTEEDVQPEALGSYVVAAMDVPAHTILTPADVTEVEVPADEVPPDAVTNIGTITGMAYRTPLTMDQVLMSAQLENPGLSNDVSGGMRAIALPVDEGSALYGLLASDDHVDIVFKARLDLIRLLPGTVAEMPVEDAVASSNEVVGADDDVPAYPATGDEGSRVFVRDVSAEFEPVAKVLLQDIRVLRVVRPGQSFSADGQPVDQVVVEAPAASEDAARGALILEVTAEQAEAITFMQDANHTYQIVVRGREDHDIVNTSGITFEILAKDEDYALPLPAAVTVEEPRPASPEARSRETVSGIPPPPAVTATGAHEASPAARSSGQ